MRVPVALGFCLFLMNVVVGEEQIMFVSATGNITSSCYESSNPCESLQSALDVVSPQTTSLLINVFGGDYFGGNNVGLIFPAITITIQKYTPSEGEVIFHNATIWGTFSATTSLVDIEIRDTQQPIVFTETNNFLSCTRVTFSECLGDLAIFNLRNRIELNDCHTKECHLNFMDSKSIAISHGQFLGDLSFRGHAEELETHFSIQDAALTGSLTVTQFRTGVIENCQFNITSTEIVTTIGTERLVVIGQSDHWLIDGSSFQGNCLLMEIQTDTAVISNNYFDNFNEQRPDRAILATVGNYDIHNNQFKGGSISVTSLLPAFGSFLMSNCDFDLSQPLLIMLSGGNSTITNCNFRTIYEWEHLDANAIHATAGIIDISGCTFQNGYARAGGSLFIENFETLLISDSFFEANEARGYGGAIFLYQDGSLGLLSEFILDSVDFIDNMATNGAAVACGGFFTIRFAFSHNDLTLEGNLNANPDGTDIYCETELLVAADSETPMDWSSFVLGLIIVIGATITILGGIRLVKMKEQYYQKKQNALPALDDINTVQVEMKEEKMDTDEFKDVVVKNLDKKFAKTSFEDEEEESGEEIQINIE